VYILIRFFLVCEWAVGTIPIPLKNSYCPPCVNSRSNSSNKFALFLLKNLLLFATLTAFFSNFGQIFQKLAKKIYFFHITCMVIIYDISFTPLLKSTTLFTQITVSINYCTVPCKHCVGMHSFSDPPLCSHTILIICHFCCQNSDSEEVSAGGGGGKKGGGSGRRRKVSQPTSMPPISGDAEAEEDLSYIQGIEVDYEQEEDVDEYLEDRQKKESSGQTTSGCRIRMF